MKKWLLLPAIIVLVTLQLTWPGFLTFFNCKPDLLLAFTISLVFYFDFKTAFIFGVLSGFTKDIFLPQSFAVNTIYFGLWSFLIYRLSRQISSENDYVRLSIVVITVFFNNIITGLGIINSGGIIPGGIFLRNLIILPIYSAALSPLVFKFTKKIAMY